MTIKKLYSWLRDQCDYVATMAREFDPDPCNDLEAAEIVEEARRQCARLGFDDLGDEVTVISARSALPILGKMLAWARERKSKSDWLTPPQVARIMGVKPDKVLYWIHTGKVNAVNVAKEEGGRPQFARRLGSIQDAPVYSPAGAGEAGAADEALREGFLLKSHLRTWFATLNKRFLVMRSR